MRASNSAEWICPQVRYLRGWHSPFVPSVTARDKRRRAERSRPTPESSPTRKQLIMRQNVRFVLLQIARIAVAVGQLKLTPYHRVNAEAAGSSFDRNALGQVPWLVDIAATQHRAMVGKKL
jgi:hypothetical protein